MTGEDLQIFVETSIACKEAIARAERAEAELAERDKQPPDFTTTGDFRRARGVIPWQPGDEPAEITIRRLRDAPEHAERVELGPITQESLLPDVMPPLGRRTIEIMERKIAPSDNESEG